jgi:hypothetical protein
MGFAAKEGRVRVANDLHNGQTITGFKLALFTNAVGAITEDSVTANLTQPTGGGYAAVNIAKSGWTVDATGNATRPNVDFIATGSAYNAAVTGAALLVTYSGSDYLYGVQYFPVSRTMSAGNKLTINLNDLFA